MLVGSILYLLEWVAIIPFATGVLDTKGLSPDEIVAAYADNADGAAIMAGWFSVVLLGRIAIAAGLRGALRNSPRQLHLMDFAIGAMVVSVALEVAGFGLGAAAGWLAREGGDPSAIVALDAGGAFLYQILVGPLAVFLLVSGLAMLRSGFFPAWMSWLGIAAGVVGIPAGVIAAAAFDGGTLRSVFDAAFSVLGLGFWVWMLATGIFLSRRAGRHEEHEVLAG